MTSYDFVHAQCTECAMMPFFATRPEMPIDCVEQSTIGTLGLHALV